MDIQYVIQFQRFTVSRIGNVEGHQSGFTAEETVGGFAIEVAERDIDDIEYRSVDFHIDAVIETVAAVPNLKEETDGFTIIERFVEMNGEGIADHGCFACVDGSVIGFIFNDLHFWMPA